MSGFEVLVFGGMGFLALSALYGSVTNAIAHDDLSGWVKGALLMVGVIAALGLVGHMLGATGCYYTVNSSESCDYSGR